MKCIKSFSRSVRREINRISITLKQIEFQILRMKGFLKRKLREEIHDLKRIKKSILHRLSQLTAQATLDPLAVQSIRQEITVLNERCYKLKKQYT